VLVHKSFTFHVSPHRAPILDSIFSAVTDQYSILNTTHCTTDSALPRARKQRGVKKENIWARWHTRASKKEYFQAFSHLSACPFPHLPFLPSPCRACMFASSVALRRLHERARASSKRVFYLSLHSLSFLLFSSNLSLVAVLLFCCSATSPFTSHF